METIILIITLIISIFVVLGFHELGHLIAGLIQGFRFELYVVGPLGIKREENKINVYFNTNLSYFGGVAATLPTEDHIDNAQKFARLILAGPLASLLLSVIGFAMLPFINEPYDLFFFALGAISMAIFFATTLPSKSGMFFTDRKRYQRLTKPGQDREVEMALLRIMAIYSKNESYKDIDENDLQLLMKEEFPFFRFYGMFCMKCYLLENEKNISEEFEQEYDVASLKISKKMKEIFDKELEKLNEKMSKKDSSKN